MKLNNADTAVTRDIGPTLYYTTCDMSPDPPVYSDLLLRYKPTSHANMLSS